MKKQILFLIVGIILTFGIVSCSTKTEENKNVPYVPEQKQQEEVQTVPNAGADWEELKIQVIETPGGKTTDYNIKIGADFTQIANTNMKLKVEEFIPDFYMAGQNKFGSRSKELNNPAALIVVSEEGKPEPFKGWIFSKYPDVHKGPSEKFSFRLVDFIKKSN